MIVQRLIAGGRRQTSDARADSRDSRAGSDGRPPVANHTRAVRHRDRVDVMEPIAGPPGFTSCAGHRGYLADSAVVCRRHCGTLETALFAASAHNERVTLASRSMLSTVIAPMFSSTPSFRTSRAAGERVGRDPEFRFCHPRRHSEAVTIRSSAWQDRMWLHRSGDIRVSSDLE
jgi:hypothetical protein